VVGRLSISSLPCSFARGILAGLCELHSARIAMLDVKPGNVLLADDGSPVLTDFGISRELRDASLMQVGQFAALLLAAWCVYQCHQHASHLQYMYPDM
jgi:serine/threonine protein kinase